ncbi:MAG: shikimate kinase [Chthoniobacterales bacterium]
MNSLRSIVLIGMMGAGKSSIGRLLQRRTGLTCFDTDELVAAEFGLSIPEIFARLGEERFRGGETEVLRKLFLPQPIIVVTGGGTVLRQENVDLLKRLGSVIWLSASESTLFERASRRGERPLLKTADPRKTFSELLCERAPLYAAAADFEIDTSLLTHDEIADEILSKLEQFRVIEA